MKKGISIVVVSLLLLNGCVVTKIHTMPTREFDAGFDTVWDGIIQYLDRQKEPITTADKKNGVILTDWVIIKKVFSSKRYRYEIKVTRLKDNRVQVGIASPQQVYSMGDWEDLLPTERRANRIFRYLSRITKQYKRQAGKQRGNKPVQNFKGVSKRRFYRKTYRRR